MSSCRKFLVIVSCALVQIHNVEADEGDVVNVYTTISSARDSNLFRLSPSVTPQSVGLQTKADNIASTVVGINLNKLFSLQRVVANISLMDSRYQRNDYLNFQALNYDAHWYWAFGRRWTGELAVDRSQALNSYTDYTNYHERNVRITEKQSFSGNYWFHSSWAAVLGVTNTKVTNELVFLEDSDYELAGYNLGLRYRPRSGNTLVLRAKHLDGTYAKRQFNSISQYDNAFKQRGFELNIDWSLTGKSLLRGRIERIERKHEHFASRDYAGWVGNADYIYAASGKSAVTLGYRHGLENFQQSTSSFYVLDEFNLAAEWAATGKLTATARMGAGRRNYRGEIVPLPAGVEPREDKFARLGIDLDFHPARWIALKAGLGLENRNANNDALDYRDRTGFVSATAQF